MINILKENTNEFTNINNSLFDINKDKIIVIHRDTIVCAIPKIKSAFTGDKKRLAKKTPPIIPQKNFLLKTMK